MNGAVGGHASGSDDVGLARTESPWRRWLRPWWAVASLLLGVLLLAGSISVYVGGDVLLSRFMDSIRQQDLLGPAGAAAENLRGPVNVLLVGLDTRPNNPAMGSRADSIIVVHIPASHDRAYLISIPRDTNVAIPPFPRTHYTGGMDKINAAYQFGSADGGGASGGVQLLAMSIRDLTGITFNAATVVDFGGFKDVVSALGGVNMCVDEKTTSIHDGFKTGTNIPAAPFKITDGGAKMTPIKGVTPVTYYPGCQHLSAREALDYVRQRDLLANHDGDYGRERHQQQFVKALMQEGIDKGLSNPLTLNTFLSKVGKAFVFDGHGVSLTDWIFTFKQIEPSHMVLVKTNDGRFDTVYVGGQAREQLSDLSRQLLEDVKTDTVGSFVSAHPSWVSSGG